MKLPKSSKANLLGDVRAEFDHAMLDQAFYESPDYKSLIESGDRTVIVGRRGVGKSALFYRLKKHLLDAERTKVITISPEDYETLSLQGTLSPFGSRLSLVRAAAKLAWRYALVMEIATAIRSHYKFSGIAGIPTLLAHLKDWIQTNSSVPSKMRRKVEPMLAASTLPERAVGDLANALQLNTLLDELKLCLSSIDESMFILIDRLDEGYEANDLGIGLIDGFLHASIEMNRTLHKTKVFTFLRDNIFRTIAKVDSDYSRQIEGQVIRLHWDEYHLLNLAANRIRVAFSLTEEESIAIWNKATCGNIYGRDGFRRCLRLTLYRPRDLLVLLNNAFYHAFHHNRRVIHELDIEDSAKQISESRYADLLKEYLAIFPGLDRITRTFADGPGEWSVSEAMEILRASLIAPNLTAEEAQHFAILATPESALHALYSVGFLGLQDFITGRFRFCHDGSLSKLEIADSSKFLIHPCYWRALNITSQEMQQDTAEELPAPVTEIADEYDIEVTSTTPNIRKHRIGQIISNLASIPLGREAASQFEDWCHQAISILFAAGLRNIELKPNNNATQRRDIVARNNGSTDSWKRILDDYSARQVIFEAKNYVDLGPDEYRQMQSYLVRDYGSLGFIITRDADESLRKDKELRWVREIYHEHKKLIIKLTSTWLSKFLSKARNPQKHDAADIALGGLLDRYVRNYLSLR